MQKKAKIRALLIASFITLCFFALIGRVYWLQIVNAEQLMLKAQSIWEKSRQLIPERGTIYDRNNKVLAQDVVSYIVSVNPRLIHEKGLEDEVVEALAPILDMTDYDKKQKLYSLVTDKREDGTFYVQREIRNEGWKIDRDKANQIERVIEEQNLYGTIHLEEVYKRYYPANDMAAHVLGYINLEGEPVSGLEDYYNEALKGTPGEIQYEQDAKGYELPGAKVIYKPAENGKALRLTIDENIQLYMEEAMKTAYEKYQPASMSAIAVDPTTLEILGMANFPNFNPNSYWDFQSFQDFNNYSIMHAFEPGSTFKVITLAAAVEEGVFHPDDTYQSGSISVPGGTIRDHNWTGWGEITFLEGLKRSSNVGFVELGYNLLGKEKLIEYYEKFGFGSQTGIDLPGEATGSIAINRPIEVATSTFGQGVSTTAIQQITAISAIANGGYLMKPHIVKEVIDTETSEIIEVKEPEVIRQVISEETAKKTAYYLEQVIADQEIGTGAGAYIEGYRIAGKTGTAQKFIDGQYSDERYIISFIGFAPVEDPKIALLVIADDPDIGGDYRMGSSVVTPVFKEIMLQSLRYLGVNKTSVSTSYEEQWMEEVPDVTGKSQAFASNILANKGLTAFMLGEGKTVIRQHPDPGMQLMNGGKVYLLMEDPDHITVPDLTSQSLRDALQVCLLLELECEVDGEGYVVSQTLFNQDDKRKLLLQLSPNHVTTIEEETKDDMEEADVEQVSEP